MYETIDEIEGLFGEVAESVDLEFKSGRMFETLSSDTRREFVKDVTAFANAGGGTIIIGVAEDRHGQRRVAARFEAVGNNARVSVEQLANIIKSNTDPVFGGFDIHELEYDGGRILVIEIEQADTAHQNKLDQRYYQRTGPISEAMYDFAIRDVMNRRTRPQVTLAFQVQIIQHAADLQSYVYRVVPILLNDGSVTVRHWALSVDLPANVVKIGSIRAGMPMRHMGNVRRSGIEYLRVELHSGPTPNNQAGTLLLPGQTRQLTLDSWFAEIDLAVSRESRLVLERNKPSVHWSFFLDGAPRKDGEISFSEWCRD